MESMLVRLLVKNGNAYKGDCKFEKCVDVMSKVRYLWQGSVCWMCGGLELYRLMGEGCVERGVGKSGCSYEGVEGTSSEEGWVMVGCVWVSMHEGW
jgi:hypothetical protein